MRPLRTDHPGRSRAPGVLTLEARLAEPQPSWLDMPEFCKVRLQ